jgi:hypothetical protein
LQRICLDGAPRALRRPSQGGPVPVQQFWKNQRCTKVRLITSHNKHSYFIKGQDIKPNEQRPELSLQTGVQVHLPNWCKVHTLLNVRSGISSGPVSKGCFLHLMKQLCNFMTVHIPSTCSCALAQMSILPDIWEENPTKELQFFFYLVLLSVDLFHRQGIWIHDAQGSRMANICCTQSCIKQSESCRASNSLL